MVKASIYTIKGNKTGELTLPKEVFGAKPNLNLLAQVAYVYQERSHVGLRKTKTRSEVNRTTKKVYKQKGTGGARHGSRRAPIFVGGGVALGPRAVRRILNIPKNLKTKAKVHAFSFKSAENDIVLLDGIAKFAKTKDAGEFIKKLGKETETKKFSFVLSDGSIGTRKFLKNLKNVRVFSYKNINAFNILEGGTIVLDKDIFAEKKKATPAKK